MTNIEKVRLLIGDRPPLDLVFTDDEIESFLDDNSNSVKLAAAVALEAWAAMYTLNPSSENIGDYSYTQRVADNMIKLAERFRKDEAETPAMTWAELDLLGSD
jgi:hypothetical protein